MSPARRARRARILAVARQLIAERGYDRLTMQEIATGAEVTKKTLYDIYQSKDNLLAQSVAERMMDLLGRLSESASGPPLPRLLHIVDRTIDAVLEMPELSRAVEPILLLNPGSFGIGAYFDRLHRPCIEELRAGGELAPWAGDDFLLNSMMSDQIAVQNFWANGRIRDGHLKPAALLSLCRILLPPACGALQAELLARCRELHRALDA